MLCVDIEDVTVLLPRICFCYLCLTFVLNVSCCFHKSIGNFPGSGWLKIKPDYIDSLMDQVGGQPK